MTKRDRFKQERGDVLSGECRYLSLPITD